MGIKRPICKMVSDVTRTSRSHGESSCFCGNDKSSKSRLLGSLENAGSFEAKDRCYSSEVLDNDGGNDSVMDTMSVLIQK